MLSNKDSVTIVISYFGEEQEIKRIVNYIKQKEGTVIAVTKKTTFLLVRFTKRKTLF